MNESSKDRKLPYRHRYKLILSIGYPTAQRTKELNPSVDSFYDEDEWNAMALDEQEAWLDEFAKDWANEFIDISWSE